MENSNHLEKLIGTYEENKTATGSTLLIGLACLALTPLMVILFLGEKQMSFNKFLFAAAGVSAAIGGLGAIWSSVRNRGGRVRIYENGLEVEKRGKRQTALWSEIAVLREKIEKIFVNDRHIYDRYGYRLEKTNGETIDLSNMISNIDEIGTLIKGKTFENLYPQVLARIDNGERVDFGSLAIDRNGLNGIPWMRLSSVKLKEGVLEIKGKDGESVISAAYAATPNAHLLMALLKERLPFEN